MKFTTFLHGGDYNPEQWIDKDYKEVINDDLKRLKESGINFVTLGVFSWSYFNPSEDIYNFEYLDYAIDTYLKNGFKIIMASPSGGFPNWLKSKYPSINRVNKDNQRQLIGDRHNHCYSSEDTIREIAKINETLANRYKDKDIVLWHISNEMQGECYCENCINKYRKWLENRYKTIDKLNEVWNMNFWGHKLNSFEEVNPPFSYGDGSNPSLYLSWSRFNTYNAREIYKVEKKSILKYIPNAKTTTNLCYGMGHNFNYFDFAREMEIVSWDSYHEWHRQDDYDTALYAMLNFDLMRGLKQKNFFLMESTPNTANWRYASKNKREGVNEITSMLSIACGSESVGYFQMRRSKNHAEIFHSAIIDDFVSENRFTKETKVLGDNLNTIEEIINSEVKKEVALIYDWEIKDIIDINVGPRKIGGMQYLEYIEELYKELVQNNLDIDIVNLNSKLEDYKVIILPMHFMLSENKIKYLEELGNKGIKIIITGFTGLANEENTLQFGGRNKILDSLLGNKVVEYEALYDEDFATITYLNKEYKTKRYHEYVKVDSASILATYNFDLYNGSPFITQNNNFYYIAGIVDPRIITSLMENEMEITLTKTSYILRKRYTENFIYEFYFNFKDEEVNVKTLGYDMLDKKEVEQFKLNKYEYKVIKKKNKKIRK